jgi:hypothetical protein
MLRVKLMKLLQEFHTAISSDQNDEVLDPSIERLREKICDPDFLKPFSIYSKAQLLKLREVLGEISNSALKDDPLGVALAVDEALRLFRDLEATVEQSQESQMRIEARRSVPASRAV